MKCSAWDLGRSDDGGCYAICIGNSDFELSREDAADEARIAQLLAPLPVTSAPRSRSNTPSK